MQLIAETNDPEFFRKTMNEMGTLVYSQDDKGNIKEAVYFSGSRVVRLKGKIPEDVAKLIKAEGHAFTEIEIDIASGCVFLKQTS